MILLDKMNEVAVNSMRVLVTGGAGFIGANLVRLLLERGCSVTVLDSLTIGNKANLDGLPIEFIQGDILDFDLVRRVVVEHEGIVHLAAQTGVPGSVASPRRDCEVNILGTLNLLEACRAEKQARGASANGHSLPRFVFASSNAPLGRQEPPATEDKAPLPISPYGASKLAGEAYCLAYHGTWELPTVVLRFGNVYGPFSAHKSSVVAKFLKDVLAGRELTVDGSGVQTRDFIYVGDLCRAIILALSSNLGGEVFQIATGVETSILQLAEVIRTVAQGGVSWRHGPSRVADIQQNYSVITKARAILRWEPAVTLGDGVHQTLDWLREQQL